MQAVRLARCYQSQLKVVTDGLHMVMCSTGLEPRVVSQCSLELFLNAVLLNLVAGKTSVALKCFEQAKLLAEEGRDSALPFRGMWTTWVQIFKAHQFLAPLIP